jgi:pterin-4a-carbinolamine dehydratase
MWQLNPSGKSIVRAFTARNFQAALDFINRAGAVAEAEGHHPDLHIVKYRDVRVEERPCQRLCRPCAHTLSLPQHAPPRAA